MVERCNQQHPFAAFVLLNEDTSALRVPKEIIILSGPCGSAATTSPGKHARRFLKGFPRDRVSAMVESSCLPGLATCPQPAFGSVNTRSLLQHPIHQLGPTALSEERQDTKEGDATYCQMKDGRRLLRGAPPEGQGALLPFGKQAPHDTATGSQTIASANKTTQLTGNLPRQGGLNIESIISCSPRGSQKCC